MSLRFERLTEPTTETVRAFNRWENDSTIIHLIRPNFTKEEFEHREEVTLSQLKKRLENHRHYLIYSEDKLIGEMNYMIDPVHLFKREPETAWIGITIGEPEGRGKGIGFHAIQHLEREIEKEGLKRIELGVFEYNTRAIKLYEKLGYKKIGELEDFTYWQDRMWKDIRMEKYL
ncbi:GNAT family N-acetyltransferase [Bacillus sp. SCS-153A]|uniref:GNAT family N-acetyltransferase n=1 Tax=Rossellomorea sedimentorum TaxID=3115294 RepID=UPI00390679B0